MLLHPYIIISVTSILANVLLLAYTVQQCFINFCYSVLARKSISDIHIPEMPTPSEASVMNGFDVDMYDDLKSSYAHMLTAFRQYLGTIDLGEVKFFL